MRFQLFSVSSVITTVAAGIAFLVPHPAEAGTVNSPNFPQQQPAEKAKAADVIEGQYIIKFSTPPLAVYGGNVPGLPATIPSAKGARKLNAADADSTSYLAYVQARQTEALQGIEQAIGRALPVNRTYKAAFNGIAVQMSEAEARQAVKLPGVAAVIPDRLRQLHTDNGPKWIGADDLWGGTVSTATMGEGIVIGVIDTGINPANPSFADIGGDGYDHDNPRGRYYGFCDPAHPDYTASFACNDKLIGAYDLTRTLPTLPGLYDSVGHGSHTASTAAGNFVSPASIVAPTTTINRNISGLAPHSNIISYKVCPNNSCLLSAILAGIDQATLDGVDVINYSIGGSAANPWNDADSEAFLNARQAGIFVSVSAGNSGPSSATVGSPANSPWLLAAGNSSHNRRFANTLNTLTSTGAGSLPDISGVGMTGSLSARSIVYAGNYGNPLCPIGAFPPGTFTGQIVVCDRGTYARVDKGTSVLNGGAGGMVLANDATSGDSLVADAHYLPAVHITYSDGVTLKAWLASGSNHQAAISGTSADENTANGDIMTSTSSRGVNSPVPSIIKPDVSAPGLDILAANGINNAATWGLMTGTSMASPHAAGAAALLISLHPEWSPAEVQSALMSTAVPNVLKEDDSTPATPFDTGSGRVDVSQAAQAGLILDETYANYLAADPSLGGDPKNLNIPSLANENFLFSASWTRTVTATTSGSWVATVTSPPGVNLSVSPSNFSLTAGASRQITITATAFGVGYNSWLFGSVLLTPSAAGTASTLFPVALKRSASLSYDDARRNSFAIEKNLKSVGISNLTVARYGLSPATTAEAQLYQDPTPSVFHDPHPVSTPDEGLWAADGLWVKKITVPAGTERLVTDILATTAPDLDMYLYRWNGSGWEWHCSSAGYTSDEKCIIINPVAGDYFVWVQNYQASDPGGATPDDVELATAVVPAASSVNFRVSLANNATSVPAGQLFDLKISWGLLGPETHWYGSFDVGTDPANPDNLEQVDFDLHLMGRSLFFPIKSANGTTIINLN